MSSPVSHRQPVKHSTKKRVKEICPPWLATPSTPSKPRKRIKEIIPPSPYTTPSRLSTRRATSVRNAKSDALDMINREYTRYVVLDYIFLDIETDE